MVEWERVGPGVYPAEIYMRGDNRRDEKLFVSSALGNLVLALAETDIRLKNH
jgi:predicted small integral membrane protein